jgi:glutamate racemase
MSSDPRPIGVFDSGVGGLSVLSVLIKNFPSENFVYLGDTARLPYGSKSPATIQKYVTQNINYLVKHQDVKAVVIACNSASTVLNDLDLKLSIPIFGVILPGAKTAYHTSKNKKIGLWATRATVKQGS